MKNISFRTGHLRLNNTFLLIWTAISRISFLDFSAVQHLVFVIIDFSIYQSVFKASFSTYLSILTRSFNAANTYKNI